MSAASLRPVLDRFLAPSHVVSVEPLRGGGGFSGSQLWKVIAEAGAFCLRRWPGEHPSAERLAFIHSLQLLLRQAGLTFVPVPQTTTSGSTFLDHDGCLWELATWMPGTADFHARPSPARLGAAMTALAKIHNAAATMPGQARLGTSPGLTARLDQLRQLRAGGIDALDRAIARRPLAWNDLAQRVCQPFRALAPQVEPLLAIAAAISGPLFLCLRDIWHDHVLFTGEEVTGVIDFGAVRVESPAGDIARLVGSLVADDADRWREALAAYQTVRPLDDAQHQLIRAFDTSGVLLSGINWLTWLYVEGRQFEDAAAVTRRLEEIVSRLE